jgi:hypothetical protein
MGTAHTRRRAVITSLILTWRGARGNRSAHRAAGSRFMCRRRFHATDEGRQRAGQDSRDGPSAGPRWLLALPVWVATSESVGRQRRDARPGRAPAVSRGRPGPGRTSPFAGGTTSPPLRPLPTARGQLGAGSDRSLSSCSCRPAPRSFPSRLRPRAPLPTASRRFVGFNQRTGARAQSSGRCSRRSDARSLARFSPDSRSSTVPSNRRRMTRALINLKSGFRGV